MADIENRGQTEDREGIIENQIDSVPYAPTAVLRRKWRLLLPGASEPRLTELNPLGL
jgi:hypothetical protein